MSFNAALFEVQSKYLFISAVLNSKYFYRRDLHSHVIYSNMILDVCKSSSFGFYGFRTFSNLTF